MEQSYNAKKGNVCDNVQKQLKIEKLTLKSQKYAEILFRQKNTRTYFYHCRDMACRVRWYRQKDIMDIQKASNPHGLLAWYFMRKQRESL